MSEGLILPGDTRDLLWWVLPGRLAGMPMPYLNPERRLAGGGALDAWDDELPKLHRAGIRAVVSLLDLPGDRSIYHQAGFEFAAFPVPDGAPPGIEQARAIVTFIRYQLNEGRPVAVHCMAGIGRTGTALAAYLIAGGMSAREAVLRTRAAEPAAIETRRQLEFLEDFERICKQSAP